jgi:hypothetical protein
MGARYIHTSIIAYGSLSKFDIPQVWCIFFFEQMLSMGVWQVKAHKNPLLQHVEFLLVKVGRRTQSKHKKVHVGPKTEAREGE